MSCHSAGQSARRSLSHTMPDLPLAMPLTKAGRIRVHGPVEDWCPGSQNPSSLLPQRERTPTQNFCPRRPLVNILKRIPRASRGLAARKLATILGLVSTDNSVASWNRLSSLYPVVFEYRSEVDSAEVWPPM